MESQRTATPTVCSPTGGIDTDLSLTYVMGAASWLSHQDPNGLNWPIHEFHLRVCTAMGCGQAMIFRDGETPAGFVTWAWLGEDEDRRYRLRPFQLTAADRQSGPHLWLVDALVLPPYSRSVADHVLNRTFEAGTPVRWLSRGSAGRVNRTLSGTGEEEKLWRNWP